MRIILTLILIFALYSQEVHSQNVKIIKVEKRDKTFKVKYRLLGTHKQSFTVRLKYKTDSTAELRPVTGDLDGEIKGLKKGVHTLSWTVDDASTDALEGLLIFGIEADTDTDEIRKSWFGMAQFSLDSPSGLELTSDTPIGMGLMLGRLGGIDFYVSYKRGAEWEKVDDDLVFTDNSWQPPFSPPRYYRFNQERKIRRLSYTAGLTGQVGANSFIFVGAGYGEKDYLAGIDTFSFDNDQLLTSEFVKLDDAEFSFTGVQAEAGFIFRYDHFIASIGVSSLNLKYNNWSFGIGINLN